MRKVLNIRTILIFTATLAAGIYFASWYISQYRTKSTFVVNIPKEFNPRISNEERDKLANEKCDNPNPSFDRRYSPFRINPLLIYVTAENGGRIHAAAFERSDLRLVSDVESLKNALKNLLEERKKYLVFEECNHTTIMRTVMFRASRSIKYGEVVKVIDALKEIGAEPIVLQIDDLPN
jgi:biopolymer transport protein ExbD